jgi:hypothetical protein
MIYFSSIVSDEISSTSKNQNVMGHCYAENGAWQQTLGVYAVAVAQRAAIKATVIEYSFAAVLCCTLHVHA